MCFCFLPFRFQDIIYDLDKLTHDKCFWHEAMHFSNIGPWQGIKRIQLYTTLKVSIDAINVFLF